MTRKDYQIIARAINEVVRHIDRPGMNREETIEAVVANLCHHLAMDNQRFDRERFKQAALKQED